MPQNQNFEGRAMRAATAEPGREKTMEQLLNRDVIDLLVSIVSANQEIEVVFLGQPYINVPLLNRPDLVPSDRDLISTAWQQSMASGAPVWDSVMLLLTRPDRVSDTILSQAMVHHGIAETRFAVMADGFADKIRELAESRPTGQILAMCSDVQLKTGETKHIPMIDFRCPVSPHSLQLISKVAKLLDVGKGFIVETDRSYHFYGAELLTERQWLQFLGRALQFSPIVDRAWIAHQLIDTCCNLRIASRLPEGKKLRVVAVVE
jgi:hypothetical protein